MPVLSLFPESTGVLPIHVRFPVTTVVGDYLVIITVESTIDPTRRQHPRPVAARRPDRGGVAAAAAECRDEGQAGELRRHRRQRGQRADRLHDDGGRRDADARLLGAAADAHRPAVVGGDRRGAGERAAPVVRAARRPHGHDRGRHPDAAPARDRHVQPASPHPEGPADVGHAGRHRRPVGVDLPVGHPAAPSGVEPDQGRRRQLQHRRRAGSTARCRGRLGDGEGDGQPPPGRGWRSSPSRRTGSPPAARAN